MTTQETAEQKKKREDAEAAAAEEARKKDQKSKIDALKEKKEEPEEEPVKPDPVEPELSEVDKKFAYLTKIIEDQAKQIDMLIKVSDKARLASYEEKNPKSFAPKVLVSTYMGKFVTGWHMTMNNVYKDANDNTHVEQVVEIVVEGENDPVTMGYRDFALNKIQKISGIIVKRAKFVEDDVERETVTVRVEDKISALNGKEIELDVRFIN